MNYHQINSGLLKGILYLFLLTSCATIKDVEGVYESRKGAYFKIELKSDRTFKYRTVQGLLRLTSSGSWSQKGNIISIKSEKQYKSNYIELVSQISNKGMNKIQFIDNLDQLSQEGFIYLNGDYTKEYSTDKNGLLFTDKKIDSIYVVTIGGLKSLELNCKDYCSFVIKVVPETSRFEYFENEKFRVKQDKLIQVHDRIVYRKK